MALLDPGDYIARGVEARCDRTDGGTWYVEVLFEISDGDHAGTRLRWRGFASEKAWPYTYRQLRECGDVIRDNDIFDLGQVGDNEVRLKVIIDEYNDRRFNKVDFVNNLTGAVLGQQKADASELEDFRRRMRGQIAALAQETAGGAAGGARPPNGRASAPAPAPRPAPQRAPQGVRQDDDIPF